MFRVGGALKTLKTAMPWAGGPTRIELDYVPLYERRETINKKVVTLHQGFRVRVMMTFAIGSTMSDHSILADIVNALVTQDRLVELTLENNTKFKPVELVRYEGPDPFDGKTFSGAFFKLQVETADVIPQIPPIGSGVWMP